MSLTYEGRNEPTLKECNFNIKRRKGGSARRIGSGKSTLLGLIAGVHQATSGAVMLDDADIRNLRHEDIRNNIGVVLQNPLLFSGTIRENLLMGNPDASDEQLLKAAEMSGRERLLVCFPMGLILCCPSAGRNYPPACVSLWLSRGR